MNPLSKIGAARAEKTPCFGLQFFGHVAIDGASEVMTVTLKHVGSDDLENLVPLLPHKGALAIAAVIDIALNARERPVAAKALATRLRLPPRHLEPMLQALVHHGILKGTRGPRGGYELAREQRRITADHILRAIGMADEMERMPFAGSNLLCKVVIPALEQAERAFSAMLARINVEDLAHSAGALRKSAGATSTFAP